MPSWCGSSGAACTTSPKPPLPRPEGGSRSNPQRSAVKGLLEGKKVLATGAARGLGLEFARNIVQGGGSVVLADILAEQAEAAAAQLREQGYEAHAVALDLNDPASI